ncbi:MAG: TIR domain-containing protein [Actinobacteria bacterium]|nr:TIR domain-containing protein [Actinomycetota bacterium]
MHLLQPGVRGFRVRESTQARPKLFLTFAGVDLALARPVAAQLRSAGGGLILDWAVSSEPFAAQRSDLIRASLALRLKRCVATICLFGAETLEDDWVRWTLATAQQLRHPLLGASFAGAASGDVAELLESIGAEIVPLRGEAIAQRLTQRPVLPPTERLTADDLFSALQLMRHPLR